MKNKCVTPNMIHAALGALSDDDKITPIAMRAALTAAERVRAAVEAPRAEQQGEAPHNGQRCMVCGRASYKFCDGIDGTGSGCGRRIEADDAKPTEAEPVEPNVDAYTIQLANTADPRWVVHFRIGPNLYTIREKFDSEADARSLIALLRTRRTKPVSTQPVAYLVEDEHCIGLADIGCPGAFPVYRHPPTDSAARQAYRLPNDKDAFNALSALILPQKFATVARGEDDVQAMLIALHAIGCVIKETP